MHVMHNVTLVLSRSARPPAGHLSSVRLFTPVGPGCRAVCGIPHPGSADLPLRSRSKKRHDGGCLPLRQRPPTILHGGSSMKLKLLTGAVLVALAITALAAVTASAATVRHVEGRVSAVDRDARSFTLRDSERGTFRVFVGASTRFERISFSRLSTGSRLQASVRRSGGPSGAPHVETSGGGGRHGGATEAGDDRGGR